MSDQLQLSLLILVVGLAVVLPVVYWLSTRKAAPGVTRGSRRRLAGDRDRREPVIGDSETGLELDPELRAQLDELGQLLADEELEPEQGELLEARVADAFEATDTASAARPASAPADDGPKPGVRPDRRFDRILSLFVLAREGSVLRGDDLVVVAEKVGLIYGDMGIYHRMLDGKEAEGPVFSMANIAKPGSFDVSDLSALETSGLSFFLTLPGPMSALDAWNTMLPVAQRVAQLLDAELLDESRNPLVEQTIAFVRNEMREYDREQERHQIRANW